jgi:DNA topoisomerase-1
MPSSKSTTATRSRRKKSDTANTQAGKLIIVESPTKAGMLSRFLGDGFVVEASYGHVRDLPKSKLSVDVEHDFSPVYIIPAKAKTIVSELKKKARAATTVILAPDPDREGEAIAWHLVEALELNKKGAPAVERIAFHEITKEAVQEALAHPRDIDVRLVDAQQARRVLDRLVGYELSPFLWRKIRYGLSAGRVQSVAVRLIVEREREIEQFNREEYWSIEGSASAQKKAVFPVRLQARNGKAIGKMDIRTQKDADEIVADATSAKRSYTVSSVTTKEVRRNPSPPFTTSTLQQESARKLGWSAKQTMMIAQKLYEQGIITYMRTDSVNLSGSALAQAQHVILDQFGKPYTLPEPRRYSTKSKGAQEAHEAIRPTNLARLPSEIRASGDRSAQRLYDLIWKRTLASQMQQAVLEQTAADMQDGENTYTFRANGQVVKFDGFIRVYTEGRDDDASDELEGTLPPLTEGETVKLSEIQPLQHFTEPPPRYSDATLIKALEANGIGRPSTYAPTLSTIQDRDYVEKKEKKYHPTETGVAVNDLLVEHFPEIVDVGFTSHIEEELDEIAEGEASWQAVCREFYTPFKKHLIEKEKTVEKQVEISDTPCPHCGKPMLIKFGRMGKFLACPEEGSKVTLPMPEEAAKIRELEEKTQGELCPICSKPLKVRRGRFGFFLGCVDYPKCKGVAKIWNKSGFKCPHCVAEGRVPRGDVAEKKSRGRGKPFWGCTRYPDCNFLTNKRPESEEELQAAYVAWKEKPPKEPGTNRWGKKKAAVKKSSAKRSSSKKVS